jgi:hypothetical protein
MATVGVSEAARMVGRDVSTLHQVMKTGRLVGPCRNLRAKTDVVETVVFQRVIRSAAV